MKKLILFIILLLFANIVNADEFIIPFSVYPKELQRAFLDNGLKLDLSGNDRTRDSFGFIENRGTEFKIFTYESLTTEKMNLIMKIIMGE